MYDASAGGKAKNDAAPVTSAADFRPIHYLGSKLRFLPQILSGIDEVDPSGGTLCDLFSGSGTVSLAAALKRRVISVDIQEYSRVIASAILRPSSEQITPAALRKSLHDSALGEKLREAFGPLLALEVRGLEQAARGNLEIIRAIIEDGSVVAAQQGEWSGHKEVRKAIGETLSALERLNLPLSATVASRHFGGAYFSYSQAVWLDTIAAASRSAPDVDLRLAALLSTASEIVNSVGKQFAQPLRLSDSSGSIKTHLTTKILRDRRIDVIDAYLRFVARFKSIASEREGNVAVRSDYADAIRELGGEVSVFYADPPYTRDHYSRFYHVLETLALGDDPAVAMSNLGQQMSRGFYRADRHQSDFCIKSRAPAAFDKLISGCAKWRRPLVLSYSAFDETRGGRPRLLGIGDLRQIAEQHYGTVSVLELNGGQHSKLTSNEINKGSGTTTEVLFLCQNPQVM